MSLKIPNATMARVESSFKQLASAAQALNSASEDLSKVIRHLDASLKKLGLGVSAWVPVSGLSDDVQYWNNELGYANVDGKWGLALREITGFHLDTNDQSEQVWAYNEAPRTRRAEAVEKIPDLLEQLLQQTQETTRDLKEKIEQASEFTSVVSGLAPSTPSSTPPAASSAATPGPRKVDHEEHGAREPLPLPMERLPVERSAAANTAPQTITRFRDEEGKSSTPVTVGVRPISTSQIS